MVLFSVCRGGSAPWWFMADDGSFGDEKAGDGRYSILRVGGDIFDRGELEVGDDVPLTLSAQALDLRGNWSAPATINYRLKFSREPVWMASPTPGAPNIIEASVSRQGVFPGDALFTARCDSPDAFVCAHLVPHSPINVLPLFDNGHAPDAVAGDGSYASHVWFPWNRRWDVIYYAVPKTGPLMIGEKMAASLPPCGQA